MLGFWEWREGLLAGLAAHHAGLVPAFKETVEECFVRGLVKAVFATETLALGINMPARTVVLERLVKWNGEAHVDVTPGEYTQLTGRAGRRGIDVEGHAVVVWAPGRRPGRGRRAGQHPHLPAAVVASGPATTWRSTWSARSAGRAPASCWPPPSPSSRPTGRSSGWPGRPRGTRRTPSGSRPPVTHRPGRRRRVRAAAPARSPTGRRSCPATPRPGAGCEAAEALARAAPRRRHPGALGTAAGAGRRAGPRHHRARRPAAAGAHRGQVGRPAGLDRLPDPGRRALARVRVPKNFNHRSPHARRDLAATLRNARVEHDLGARKTRAPLGGRGRPGAGGPAARAARRTRCTQLPDREERVRGRRAVAAVGPRGRRALHAPDGRAHRLADPAVRPHLRRAGGAGLPACPTRRPRPTRHPGPHPAPDDAPVVTDGRPAAVPDLVRGRPARPPSACGPGCSRGLDAGRAGRVRLDAGLRGPPGLARRSPRCPRGRWPRRSPRCAGCTPSCTDGRDRPRRPGQPRPGPRASPGRPTAGRTGRRLDRVLAGAEQAGTELSGGDFVRWARQLVDLLDQLAKVADGARSPERRARPSTGSAAAWSRSR